MVPVREVRADTVILRSQRRPRIQWSAFCGIDALLSAIAAKPGLGAQLDGLVACRFPQSDGAFVRHMRELPSEHRAGITTLVATDGSKIAGLAQLRYTGTQATIVNLCRAPSRRYRGLGKRLLKQACRHAGDCGAICVLLRTNMRNRKLRAYYEGVGWQLARIPDMDTVEYEYDIGDDDQDVVFE